MELIEKINTRLSLAKVVSKNEVASGAYEFIFELEDKMPYESGQYVWVEIPHMHIPDVHGSRRAFSLTSTPDGTKYISILFRATQSGFNQSLRALNPGDELNIIGPFGESFCFPEDPKIPLVLLAGGVGVAPFLSLLRHAAITKSERKISLIIVNDSEERVSYRDELENYNKNTSTITVRSVVGRLSTEHLSNLSIAEHTQVYVCGPQGFVDHAHSLLKTEGIFDHQFHFEHFYPTTTVDLELSQLFNQGKPIIEDSESPRAHRRAILTYELANSAATHIVVTDIHGRIIFANRAAETITGYTPEEMLGNTPRLWGGPHVKGIL